MKSQTVFGDCVRRIGYYAARMSRALIPLLLLVNWLLAPGTRAGTDPSTTTTGPTPSLDKSQYNLFSPTPDNLLRSYSSDRPSQSTGPYTVDAGHYYFEASAVSYLFDQPNDATTVRQWNVLPLTLRLGLTDNVELSLSYANYIHLRTKDRATGTTETQSGFGDFTVQSKINLYGNNGGASALALLPFVKIPTNTDHLGNNSIEGGLGIPFQVSLPGGFGLGLETGVQFVRATGSGYDASLFNAVLIGHTLISDKLSGYGEFYDVATADSGTTHAAYLDAGLVYQILPNATIDAGCNFGITDAAPDYQPFVGFSFRW